MKKIVLRPKREYNVEHHHPWIFSGAVASVEGDPVAGDDVLVEASDGRALGWGSFSPLSQIRVRMLSFNPDVRPDEAHVRSLVASAIGRRANFQVDGRTDAFRLVHGESDGLPGVVVDNYAGHAVIQLSSVGAERRRDAIASAVMDYLPGCAGVYERSDVDSRVREGMEMRTGNVLGAEPPELIEVHEGAIRYLVDVRHGHKTGFYLDQRDAREAVGALANGAEVLNCFSYTGGFGLACRAAGAMSVTHLDLSQGALDLARRNTDLEHLCGTKCEYVCADVFKQLRLYRDQGRKFDLIVLDPPKFADTRSQLMRATRGYKDINLLAMKLLRPDGLLATFSCSGAMTPDLFDKVCAEAAFDARRDFQVIGRTRQGADHPVSLSFPEGFYLKGLLLRAVG